MQGTAQILAPKIIVFNLNFSKKERENYNSNLINLNENYYI